MATLYVNMKPGKRSKSADVAEVLTTSAVNAVTAGVSKARAGVVTLYSDAAHAISIGANPDATSDPGRQFLFPGEPLCLEGIPDGMKVAAVTLA